MKTNDTLKYAGKIILVLVLCVIGLGVGAVLYVNARYLDAEETTHLRNEEENTVSLALEQQDPSQCFTLPAGPFLVVKDIDAPWKPFWNPIVSYYPQAECLGSYKIAAYDKGSGRDAEICDFYEGVKGLNRADQVSCYELFAVAAGDPSLCAEEDFLCLAIAGNDVTKCTLVKSTSDLYHTNQVTQAYCIAYVDHSHVETRDVNNCLLITEETGWNWVAQRNGCLRKHALQKKADGEDYQDICDLMAPDTGLGYTTGNYKERCEEGTIM